MHHFIKYCVSLAILSAITACMPTHGNYWMEGMKSGTGSREVLKIAQTANLTQYEKVSLPKVDILHPLDGAIMPAEMASPIFEWRDTDSKAQKWLISLTAAWMPAIYQITLKKKWTPPPFIWETVKANANSGPLSISIVGLSNRSQTTAVSWGTTHLSISKDRLDAPILFRQVPPIFSYALQQPELMKWRLGDVSAYDAPKIIMEKQTICFSCHHSSADGRVLGMDMDFRKDKGAYLLISPSPNLSLTADDFITWNDFPKIDFRSSTGLYSRISPDGRHVISTVNEISLLITINDSNCSQLFYPLRGILAYYTLENGTIKALPGGSERNFVQTAPEWSPDGKQLLFSRAAMNQKLIESLGNQTIFASKGDDIYNLNKQYAIQFDIYQVPFNQGKGGTPIPLPGASHNDMSNYYPRYSPDGQWIVYTQSQTGLVIQPDAQLYIIPAGGGKPRRMTCNPGTAASWHAWSPNGRWLVFVSKARNPYTELYLTHVDQNGQDAPPVRLARFSDSKLAANVPEFINIKPGFIQSMTVKHHQ